MGTIKYYGISAVKFSGTTKHPHFISHIFIHALTLEDDIHAPGILVTKDKAIELMATVPFYTIVWNYQNPSNWNMGAPVEIEVVNGVSHLKTNRDKTEKDSLICLLDYKYFG